MKMRISETAGLLYKDMVQLSMSWMIFLIILVIGFIGLSLANVEGALICFLCANLAIQAVMTILPDRTSGWYGYSATLPISRKDIGSSKYLLGLLAGLIGILAGFLLYWLSASFKGAGMDQEQLKIQLLISPLIVFSSMAFMIPLNYTLPKDRTFIGVIFSFLPAAGLIYLWARQTTTVIIPGGMQMDMRLDLLAWLAGISLVLFVLSWLTAPRILARMDQKQ